MQTKQKEKSNNSLDSNNDSDHELFYYANNRIKLMKEVLKIIKPKKIKSIAPDFMKNLDIDEINSMLLEELLGISNKRLKRILNGENVDTESSSTESEGEQKSVDVISLDDISDSDDEFGLGATNEISGKDNNKKKKEKDKKKKCTKVPKPIKQEKLNEDKSSKKKKSNNPDKIRSETDNEKLMSVLEILELQARARAIRSQLALENTTKKSNEQSSDSKIKQEDSEDSDAIIIDSPRNEEIVISSSESESNCKTSKVCKKRDTVNVNDKLDTERCSENVEIISETTKEVINKNEKETKNTECNKEEKGSSSLHTTEENERKDKSLVLNENKIDTRIGCCKSDSENDDVIINLDAVDIEGIEND